jgi:hypothetical protein
MSDLLNFLSGMGGGYVKGADLMSKRKQALEIAKSNAEIRKAAQQQVADQNDMSNYEQAVTAYSDTLGKADKAISELTLPEDRRIAAANQRDKVLFAHSRLVTAAGAPGVKKRGQMAPPDSILPGWVRDPNSPYIPGGSFTPDNKGWQEFSDGLASFGTYSPAEITNAYAERYLGIIGNSANPNTISDIMARYPVHPSYGSLRGGIENVLLQQVNKNRASQGLAPFTPGSSPTSVAPGPQIESPGLAPSNTSNNSFQLGPQIGLMGRRYTPVAPIGGLAAIGGPAPAATAATGMGGPAATAATGMGGAAATGGTTGMGGPAAPAATAATGMGGAAAVGGVPLPAGMGGPAATAQTRPTDQVTGRLLSPGAVKPDDGSTFNLGQTTDFMSGNFIRPETLNTAYGAMQKRIGAKPLVYTPVKQSPVAPSAPGKNLTPAQQEAADARQVVASTNPNPAIQNATANVDAQTADVPGLTDQVREITTEAFNLFKSTPTPKIYTAKDFTTNEYGFKVDLKTAGTLAKDANEAETKLQGIYKDRISTLQALQGMARNDVLLPGELKKQTFDVLTSKLTAIEKSAMLPTNLRTALAEGHTALVKAIYAAKEAESVITARENTSAIGFGNLSLSREKFTVDKLTKPIGDLVDISTKTLGKLNSSVNATNERITANNIKQNGAKSGIGLIYQAGTEGDVLLKSWLGTINKFEGQEAFDPDDEASEKQAYTALAAKLKPQDLVQVDTYRAAIRDNVIQRSILKTQTDDIADENQRLDTYRSAITSVYEIGQGLDALAYTRQAADEKARKEKAAKEKAAKAGKKP